MYDCIVGILFFQDKTIEDGKMYIIPLTVRAYATMIWEEFPNAISRVPPDEWKSTPVWDKGRVARKHKFYNILKEGEEDENDYVLLIIDEMNTYSRKRFNLTKDERIDEGSRRYIGFRFRFCDSIIKTIEYGNKVVAHAQEGCSPKVNVLGAYDNDVMDRNMKIFFRRSMVKELSDILALIERRWRRHKICFGEGS